ncbi:hypothetical protein HYS49_03225 [Candidatus Woesearchaeota archaeon]|nr:hypothetical protein [Candidatus Woesearchaeota archaeon]
MSSEPKPCEELGKLLQQQPCWMEVPWGEWRVASLPLASFAYDPCRAIVLSDGYFVALSHIFHCDPPKTYLEPMLDELLKNSPAEELEHRVQAILVTGDAPEELEACCEQYGIPVVGRFTINTAIYDDGGRDLFVLPEIQEVRIYLRSASAQDFFGAYVARSFRRER